MNWRAIRIAVILAAVIWGAISFFKGSLWSSTRWYDRIIRFLGALLMAGFAMGIIYLWSTGQLPSK